MSLSANVNEKAALIWAIADKLTGVYKPHEYGEVILPMAVFRRFDCILAETKDAVLEKYESVKNLPMRDILLRKASKGGLILPWDSLRGNFHFFFLCQIINQRFLL